MSQVGKRWRRFLGNLLFAYTRLVARTARWQVDGRAHLTTSYASENPVMWSTWHGQAWLLIVYGERFVDVTQFTGVAVGDNRVDTLGQLATRMGATTYGVDMQGNPVAAGRAVTRVIRAMKGGQNSFIFPDGPDGPAYAPKRGVAVIARKAGASILPIGVWTRRAIHMRRWDRYMIPLPFARIHIVFGEPFYISDIAEEEAQLAHIAAALDGVRAQAQRALGVSPYH